jgi:dynein heavy chain 1
MTRTLALAGDRMSKVPVERARLVFMLAWFHAVVLERLRYVPLGWSRSLEFGEGDVTGALATLVRRQVLPPRSSRARARA